MQEVRLIDANALFNDLKASAKGAREWKEETQDEEIKIRAEQAHGTFVECALRVKNAPTIEAEPVRHGRWVKQHTDYGSKWNCSVCCIPIRAGVGISFEIERFAFCPFCGTRMDATGTNVGGKGGDDNG